MATFRRDPPAGGASVDRVAAGRFLADRFGGRAALEGDLAQGQWSRAFAFSLGGRDQVIRFNPSRDAFDLDLAAMRFATPDLPIPAVTEVGEAFGGFYAISERAFGTFLEELDGDGFSEAIPSLFAGLDAMRVADTSGTAGYGPWSKHGDGRYGSWREYLVDVESEAPDEHALSWREQLEASVIARSAFREGFRSISEVAGECPELRCVVHSDLLNRNVLVADHRLTGVFDWQCAMYGDFLYEVAWFTFCAPWHPGLSRVDFRGRTLEQIGASEPALSGFEDRIRCYELHIGLRNLVYNAWRGNRTNLDATAARTLEVVRRGS